MSSVLKKADKLNISLSLSGDTHINGLVQERSNSSALAMELHISCNNPLIW